MRPREALPARESHHEPPRSCLRHRHDKSCATGVSVNETIHPARDGWLAAIACTLIMLLFCLVALPATADDSPAAPIRAIYTQAAAGNGDTGGNFVWDDAKDRPRYLSKSLTALWAKSDARIEPGYAGPIDFDPITNSQDPQVYGFAITIEKQDAQRATVLATFEYSKPPQARKITTVTYDLVREDGAWKIDDIRGAATGNGWRWSVRQHLANFKG